MGTYIEFHSWPQELALTVFPPLLRPSLPHSNSIYGRLKAPHNVPSRHCLFAASFPPDAAKTLLASLENFTIIFADRSRYEESQIWIFNPVVTTSEPLSPEENDLLKLHVENAITFLKDIQMPEAPGWPFQPKLHFAGLHQTLAGILSNICHSIGPDTIPYSTVWNTWFVNIRLLASSPRIKRAVPEGFHFARVPEDQLDLIISTSSIPRQVSTMLLLPNIGLLSQHGKLAAWGYIGIQGDFATLYVLPEHRGKGFASIVAVELLLRLNRGGFSDMGYTGETGWVHSDVYEGNAESEGVMRSLGGRIEYKSFYIHVNSEELQTGVLVWSCNLNFER